MKNLIKISFLVIIPVIFCNAVHAQRRASDKPFTTVLSEIKQHQAMRNQMLQQMRQATPVNSTSQNTIAPQAANVTNTTMVKQNAAAGATSQQGSNNKPLNKVVKQPGKLSGNQ